MNDEAVKASRWWLLLALLFFVLFVVLRSWWILRGEERMVGIQRDATAFREFVVFEGNAKKCLNKQEKDADSKACKSYVDLDKSFPGTEYPAGWAYCRLKLGASYSHCMHMLQLKEGAIAEKSPALVQNAG